LIRSSAGDEIHIQNALRQDAALREELETNVETRSDYTENVTILFGINTWAFPELSKSDSLAVVANATPNEPVDESGNAYTLDQINQAKGLLYYYGNAGRVLGNPQIVSWDTTLNWKVAPSTPGPWSDDTYTSTGVIILQKKSLIGFDNAWFGDEYTTLKQHRLGAQYEPFITENVIGGSRAPLFTGHGGTNNVDKYSSGLYALAVCFEVTNTADYTAWRSGFLKAAAEAAEVPQFEILADADFTKDLVLTDGTVGNKMFGHWDKETRVMMFGVNNETELESLSSWLENSISGTETTFQVELSGFN
jgi:hypothetical protein